MTTEVVALLFYGPGNGAWDLIQQDARIQVARAAKVPEPVILEAIEQGDVEQTGGQVNWSALAQAYTEKQVRTRLRGYAIVSTVVGARLGARALLAALPSVAAGTTRIGAGWRVVQAGRLAGRLGLRAVPWIGWGLVAWDIYTLTTRGELWGVEVFD